MDYRRVRVKGGTYFFTVNLEDRRQSFLVDHIELLRHSFKTVKQNHPFHINSIVVLPDHLHTIWTLPENDCNYSKRWQLIKKHFSRALPDTEARNNSRTRKGERGIWQRRFWEHRIRNEDDLNQHTQYIHNNPVKHNYCQKPEDWPFSSIHSFSRH